MKTTRFILCLLGVLTLASSLVSREASADSLTIPTEASLEADVVASNDGGKRADAAIRHAVDTQNLQVLATGMCSQDPKIKIRCCVILTPYHDENQKARLKAALENDAVWEEWAEGVTDSQKLEFYKQIAFAVSFWKVFTKPEDLVSKAHRHDIATAL